MRKVMFASLLAASSMRTVMRASTPPSEEGAPPADTSGVTETGAGLSYTPPPSETPTPSPTPAPTEGQVEEKAPADDRPREWPEGVNSWEEFGKLSPEDRQKALVAATEITTQGTKDEAPVEGIDLLVKQQTEGMTPEMAGAVTPFLRSFAENGDLSAEEVAAAAKATGFSESFVQQYVDNAKLANASQADAEVKGFTDLTGGADQWSEFNTWATQALSPADHDKINAALDANKPGDVQSYVDLWRAAGGGAAPRDLTTQARTVAPGSSAEGAGGYASTAEMSKAMNDSRYGKDPAYTHEVERKVGLSVFN